MLTAIRHSLVASLFRAGTAVFSLFPVMQMYDAAPSPFPKDSCAMRLNRIANFKKGC
jgi:hypothetical protein